MKPITPTDRPEPVEPAKPDLMSLAPKREDFEDEESYREAVDFFRHRMPRRRRASDPPVGLAVPDSPRDVAPMSAPQEQVELTIEQLEELRGIANRKPQEGEDEEDDLEAIIAGEKLRRFRIRQRAAAARLPKS